MLIVMVHLHRGQHFIKESHHSGRSVCARAREPAGSPDFFYQQPPSREGCNPPAGGFRRARGDVKNAAIWTGWLRFPGSFFVKRSSLRSESRRSYSFTLSTYCHSNGNTVVVETFKSDIKDVYCVPLTFKIAFRIQH